MSNKFNFKTLAALGKYPYISKVNLRGRNGGNTTSDETIYEASNAYAQLLSGTACEVVSGSANDTANGTGARTVRVEGVKYDYTVFTEDISLNGATPVPLVNTSIIGVNKLTVLTAGSGLTNAGSIDVRTVSGSVVKSRISTNTPNVGEAHSFLYTVPANCTGLLSDINFSATAVTGDLTVYLLLKDLNGLIIGQGAAKSSLYVAGFNGAQGKIDLGSGLVVPEKTLIEAKAYVSAGVGDLVANAELLIFEKNNGIF